MNGFTRRCVYAECRVCGKRGNYVNGQAPDGWRAMAADAGDPELERAELCSALCTIIWGEAVKGRIAAYQAALRRGY